MILGMLMAISSISHEPFDQIYCWTAQRYEEKYLKENDVIGLLTLLSNRHRTANVSSAFSRRQIPAGDTATGKRHRSRQTGLTVNVPLFVTETSARTVSTSNASWVTDTGWMSAAGQSEEESKTRRQRMA